MNPLLYKFENLKKKNPLKAIHLIKTAIENEPKNYDYLVALGKYLSMEDKDKDAVKYLERAQKLQSLDDATTFILGLSYMKSFDYAMAIKYFKKINKLYPEAIYNASICYFRKGQIRQAIDEANKLRNDNKLGHESFKLVLDFMMFMHDIDNLTPELEKYKSMFGEDFFYHYVKAHQSYFKHQYLDCVYHYSRIPVNSLDRTLYLVKYANSLKFLKQYNKALEIYEEVALTNESPNYYVLNYAETLYHLGKYQETLHLLDKHKPDIVEKEKLRDLRAKAYYKLNLE